MTCDMWHVTRDKLHVTRDTFRGWTFSQNFSSLSFITCDLWQFLAQNYLCQQYIPPNLPMPIICTNQPPPSNNLCQKTSPCQPSEPPKVPLPITCATKPPPVNKGLKTCNNSGSVPVQKWLRATFFLKCFNAYNFYFYAYWRISNNIFPL